MSGRRILKWAAIVAAAVTAALLAGAAAAVLVFPDRILRAVDYSAATERLVTGMVVTGTPARPVLYVTSSDPRTGAKNRRDRMTDTNSGIISRLELTPDGWERHDIVRGLPRSRLDHATNGLALDTRTQTLYVAQGSHTNKGAPSERFAHLAESPLSASVLAVDLRRIGTSTYDLPTRAGLGIFGGRGGENHALAPMGGPVRLVATGLRNPYDIILTRSGELLATVNGANPESGDRPGAGCSAVPLEGGTRETDMLVRVRPGAFYGHANSARGECGAATEPPLARFWFSTNGLAEVTAGPLDEHLLTVSLDGTIHRVRLDEDVTRVVERESVKLGGVPLDVAVQGPEDPLPGTVWIALYADARGGGVAVLEPVDFGASSDWRTLPPSQEARQEVSFVEHAGRLFLGGGGTRHEMYDAQERRWTDLAPLPEPLDHIQGVAVGDRILYIGGLRRWPDEETGTVYVYDPERDRFTDGPAMPRPRGAGGVAVHRGKVYYAGGLSRGRAVPWLDVLDPGTGRWERLPDMPRARDHFQAVFVGDRLFVTGGRRVEIGTEMGDTEAYDVSERRWISGFRPVPTPRGGFAAAVVDGEVVVAGGEVPGRALPVVEAYDPERDTWRRLQSMPTAKHGIQAAVCGDSIHIAGGGAYVGGYPVDTHEALALGPRRCGYDPARSATTARSLVDGYIRGSLEAAAPARPTSLQVGPDGRLYVSQQDGTILAYTVRRQAAGAYEVVATEVIELVRQIDNHDDDGSSATDVSSLVTVIRDVLGI